MEIILHSKDFLDIRAANWGLNYMLARKDKLFNPLLQDGKGA